MASEPDGESSPNLSQDTVKGVQKLASRLQKTVSGGRASQNTLKDADRYVGGLLTSQIGHILRYVNDLTAKVAKPETKERLGRIHLNLMVNSKTLKAMEKTYSSLASKGAIDKQSLTQLIETDSELTGILFRMSAFLSKRRVTGTLSDNDLVTLAEMDDLLQDSIRARENIAKK
jgi:predicted membrane chloride channel (bestrophin family)